MNFVCTQDNLLKGLSQVAPIAGRNTQLPVLQHVLVQVKDNILHLTTTDLEIGVHTIIGGKMKEEGACTVPARRLLEYIQQLPNKNPIVIERKENILHITTEGFKAQFTVADADDFPLLPVINPENAISFNGKDFCDSLSDVLFAASREESRPEIRSVYINVQQNEVRMASTDSFRLGEKVIPGSFDGSFQCILPLSSAQEVVRLFSDQEVIQILPHENHVTFQANAMEFSSRLVDGTYPDYQQIIPKAWNTTVLVDKQELLRALKTLTVFLPRDSRRVQFVVSLKKEEIYLRVVGGETGEGTVALRIQGKGEDLDILLNIQYLLEGIQHIPGNVCVLQFNTGQDPVMIKPKEDNSAYVYVVMPIQV